MERLNFDLFLFYFIGLGLWKELVDYGKSD